jgi:hypothetical protein
MGEFFPLVSARMSCQRTWNAIRCASYTARTSTALAAGANARPGSMIWPTTGKRAMGARSKSASPRATSMSSSTGRATRSVA